MCMPKVSLMYSAGFEKVNIMEFIQLEGALTLKLMLSQSFCAMLFDFKNYLPFFCFLR